MFLLAFGVWSYFLWITFIVNVSQDERSWSAGSPTPFLIVHLVISVISLILGTVIGLLGYRALRAAK